MGMFLIGFGMRVLGFDWWAVGVVEALLFTSVVAVGADLFRRNRDEPVRGIACVEFFYVMAMIFVPGPMM